MAAPVVMPKLGNTVESAIILRWKKQVGDAVAENEALCEIETDKATMEVESPAAGTLLAIWFSEGDDVPVMTNIAAIGAAGEDASSLRPASAASGGPAAATPPPVPVPASMTTVAQPVPAPVDAVSDNGGISPRARNLAANKKLDTAGLPGSGPQGRVIERDVRAALSDRARVTPLAKGMLASGEFVAPEQGTGAAGRITSRDLLPAASAPMPGGSDTLAAEDDVLQVIPLKGTRKVISQRMLASMQTTAQLTMNTSADARALLDYRKRLKTSPDALGLQDVTINDLVMYVAARTLLQFPDLNAHFADEAITQYRHVHLGFAVDTARGLIVPVIRNASGLSLKQQASEARRLAAACQNGTITPDELNGGTFTITNLGNLGIESFTPILNPPQVAILGVGSVNLKPVEAEGDIVFIPHMALSLTINHQVVDGAPGARFLQALTKNLANLDLMLAF
jgi:pyruvate dehydrogenase E2 component (dihydrolipoamide acetyltransferase)